MLLASRDVPIALRVTLGTVLVRTDLPDAIAPLRACIERALGDTSLRLLEVDTALGVPVALQIVGLRLSCWDLWGTDLAEADAALRMSAAGGALEPIVGAV